MFLDIYNLAIAPPRLQWNKSPDKDFAESVLYSSTVNDFSTAAEVGRTHGTHFTHDGLANGSTHYYWVTFVDRSGNESAKFPSSNTGGVSATTTRVVDDDADQTAPGTPTLALSTVTADIDGDGSLDTGLSLSITNPNSGVPIRRYVIEISRSDTSGGTYTVWKRETVEAEDVADSLVTTYQFKANKRKFHKARVRSVAFGGKKGAFTTPTAAAQPGTYAGYNGKTTSAPSVTQVANGYRVTWSLTDASATALDTTIYKETEILVGAVTLAKVKGTSFTDTTSRTVGDTPVFTLRHYDTPGNVTTVSAGTTSPTFRALQASEADATALPAPSCLNSAGTTVASAAYLVQDNQDVDGDGKVDTAIVCQWVAVAGAVRYDVEVSRWDATSSTWKVTGLGGSAPVGVESWTFKANTSRLYKVRVRGRNFAGAAGNWTTNVVVLTTSTAFSSYTGFQPAKQTTAPAAPNSLSAGAHPMGFTVGFGAPTEPDYDHTDIGVTTTGAAPTGANQIVARLGSRNIGVGTTLWRLLYPLSTTSTTYSVWVRHTNLSGATSAWALAGTFTDNRLFGDYLVDGTIDTAQLAPGCVTVSNVNNPTTLVAQGSSGPSVGGNGTYAFLKKTNAGTAAPGDTVAGSNLVYTDISLSGGASPSGSWQCMGRCPQNEATLWLRIS